MSERNQWEVKISDQTKIWTEQNWGRNNGHHDSRRPKTNAHHTIKLGVYICQSLPDKIILKTHLSRRIWSTTTPKAIPEKCSLIKLNARYLKIRKWYHSDGRQARKFISDAWTDEKLREDVQKILALMKMKITKWSSNCSIEKYTLRRIITLWKSEDFKYNIWKPWYNQSNYKISGDDLLPQSWYI